MVRTERKGINITKYKYRIRCIDYGDLDAINYVGKDGMFADTPEDILYFEAFNIALACTTAWNEMKADDPYYYRIESVDDGL